MQSAVFGANMLLVSDSVCRTIRIELDGVQLELHKCPDNLPDTGTREYDAYLRGLLSARCSDCVAMAKKKQTGPHAHKKVVDAILQLGPTLC
jgi:hypothetical protein